MAVFERGWRAGMTVSFSVYVFFFLVESWAILLALLPVP